MDFDFLIPKSLSIRQGEGFKKSKDGGKIRIKRPNFKSRWLYSLAKL